MPEQLEGRRVAILVEDGFEQVEMTTPREALEEAGARTDLISPEKERVKAVQSDKEGDDFEVDLNLKKADPNEYDALLLPGGVKNPDKLRINPEAIKFVKAFVDAGKPIAAICHGPWTLIEAGAVKGRKMTSWAVASERSEKCWRGLGGRGSRRRPRAGYQSQTRRSAGVRQKDDRGIRGSRSWPARKPAA